MSSPFSHLSYEGNQNAPAFNTDVRLSSVLENYIASERAAPQPQSERVNTVQVPQDTPAASPELPVPVRLSGGKLVLQYSFSSFTNHYHLLSP